MVKSKNSDKSSLSHFSFNEQQLLRKLGIEFQNDGILRWTWQKQKTEDKAERSRIRLETYLSAEEYQRISTTLSRLSMFGPPKSRDGSREILNATKAAEIETKNILRGLFLQLNLSIDAGFFASTPFLERQSGGRIVLEVPLTGDEANQPPSRLLAIFNTSGAVVALNGTPTAFQKTWNEAFETWDEVEGSWDDQTVLAEGATSTAEMGRARIDDAAGNQRSSVTNLTKKVSLLSEDMMEVVRDFRAINDPDKQVPLRVLMGLFETIMQMLNEIDDSLRETVSISVVQAIAEEGEHVSATLKITLDDQNNFLRRQNRELKEGKPDAFDQALKAVSLARSFGLLLGLSK